MRRICAFSFYNSNFKIILLCGLFITLVVQPVWSYEGDCIKIGVICNGTGDVVIENISYFDLNLSLVKHRVDTTEVYNIFKSIKTLDADTDVDVITLFDYDTSILRVPQLLKTSNKKLIKWGERQSNNRQVDNGNQGRRYINPDDICGTEELRVVDPSCIKDINVPFKQRDDKVLTILGPKALTVLVKQLRWRSVFVFYETSTEIESSDLVAALSRESVLLSLFNIDHEKSLYSLLHRIYQAEMHHNQEINIIVVCQFACARTLLMTANKFDTSNREHKTLLNMFSRWLVAVYGHSQGVSRALQACANELDNVVIVAFPGISGKGTEAFNNILQSILLDILKEELHNGHLELKTALIDRLEMAAATWSPKGHCLAYNIDTLMHTKSGRRFKSVGYIEINGNVVVKSDVFPNTKYGYNKRHFNISTLVSYPFVSKKEVKGTIEYGGLCIDLLTELAKELNFTFTISEPADGIWGDYTDKEVTFNGLVGQLQREEIDMVAASLTVSSERSKVIDFSYPFYYGYTSVMIKKPDVNATKWRTLIDPFKWEILVLIGLLLPVMTTLVFLIEKYSPFYNKPEHSEERKLNGGLHMWHSSVWYMYGALLCQGGVHLPDSTAGRTLVSSWWLFCIVIVGIYSGNLIAFLAVTKEKPPFDSLAEMTKLKGSYRWGTLPDTNMAAVLLKSNHSTYKTIGDGIREFNKTDPEVLSADTDVHFRKVKEEKYAWIGEKTSIEIAMATECSLMSIKKEFLPIKYAFGFVKNSPHTGIFSKQIMKLSEGGLFQIWKRKWWPKSNCCAGKTVTEAKPISLMDVQSAFYVCLIGIFLGLVAFIIELIVHRCRSRLIKQKSIVVGKEKQKSIGNISSESHHDTIPENRPDTTTENRHNRLSENRHGTLSVNRHDTSSENRHDTFSENRHDTLSENRHDKTTETRHDTVPENET